MRISNLSSLVDAQLVLRCDATISDALHALEKNGQNFIIIIDQENKLLGMVTDGDIRRAFLKKISTSVPASHKSRVFGRKAAENSTIWCQACTF